MLSENVWTALLPQVFIMTISLQNKYFADMSEAFFEHENLFDTIKVTEYT